MVINNGGDLTVIVRYSLYFSSSCISCSNGHFLFEFQLLFDMV